MSLGSLLGRTSIGKKMSLAVILWIGGVLLLIVPIIGFGLYHVLMGVAGHHQSAGRVPSSTAIPRLSATAREGEKDYKRYCQTCHGKSARGSRIGPPLIAYDADQHTDLSFYNAVQQGVRQHHWRFGDMPAMPNVSKDAVGNIIQFVRALQAADADPSWEN